jgi:apolipoprotein N-acyltransferase
MKKNMPWLAAGLPLLIISNGRWIVPLAAWLAPVFLLRFFRGLRPGTAALAGAAVFSAASGIMLYGIIPPALGPMFFALVLYYGLLWLLPYLADRVLAPRIGGFAATLVFPAAAVVTEYANALALGDWGSLAFTQPDALALQQILSLTGIGGLTFLIAWFGAAANWAWDRRSRWPELRRGLGIYAAVVAAALLFGGLRLALFASRSATVRVAGFTLLRQGASEPKFWDRLFDKTRACAAAGAAIVLWPEAAVDIAADRKPALIERGVRAARDGRIYLLMSYYAKNPGVQGDRGVNASIFIGPDGRTLWEYVKSHPVPGSTDRPGNGQIPTAVTPFGIVGSAICYDFDFPALIRQAGRKGVDIMLDPSWDWKALDPLHTRMAVSRAVENGFSLVRLTAEGLSLAVDSQGRVLAAMDHFRTADRMIFADVPTRGKGTIYASLGDVTAWASAAVLAALPLFRRRRKPGHT